MIAKTFFSTKRKIIIATALLIGLLFLTTSFVSLAEVSAQGRAEVCQGLTGGACEDQATSDLRVAGVVQAALRILSIVVGVAGVIMVVLGGFRYITAGGDPSKIASAQNTILWALVGLAVAALSQVLVQFVLGNV